MRLKRFICWLGLAAWVGFGWVGTATGAGGPGTSSHVHAPAPLSDHAAGRVPEVAPKAVANFWKKVPEDYRIMERTPVIDSRESLLAGRKLYVAHCAVCHGSLGRGDGPGAGGLKTPPADFLDFAHSALYPPGVKYWLIAKGDKGLGMPGNPKLAPKEIWHLVNYLLALQAKVKSEGYDGPPHKHH